MRHQQIAAGMASTYPRHESCPLTSRLAQDAVPRSGRFYGLFKRAGHRVVVNALGDLLVRPSPLDASLLQVPAGVPCVQYSSSLSDPCPPSMQCAAKPGARCGGNHGVRPPGPDVGCCQATPT